MPLLVPGTSSGIFMPGSHCQLNLRGVNLETLLLYKPVVEESSRILTVKVTWFFFFSFIYISWRLITLNIVVVFAIHWYESARDLHVLPSQNSLSTPEFPWICDSWRSSGYRGELRVSGPLQPMVGWGVLRDRPALFSVHFLPKQVTSLALNYLEIVLCSLNCVEYMVLVWNLGSVRKVF